jgi:hypothetical protein
MGTRPITQFRDRLSIRERGRQMIRKQKTKLTQRGKYAIVVGYTIIMTLLLTLVWQKYDVDCVDKYTADILATQFLFGEGIDVDRALTAIYNNGGWVEERLSEDVEVIFPCLKNEGWI